MKILLIYLFALVQTPDVWKISEIHPHLSRYHNSITVTKGDSTLIVQFDFPPTMSVFPSKGDKISFTTGRKGFADAGKSFDIINIIKPNH